MTKRKSLSFCPKVSCFSFCISRLLVWSFREILCPKKTGLDMWATESNRFQPKEGNIKMEIKIVSNEWLETDEFGALHL